MTMPRLLWEVTIGAGNDTIRFDEGGGNLTATLTQGDYYLRGGVPGATDLLAEIATQMNAVGGNIYALSVSNTGIITISVTVLVANPTIHWATDGSGETGAVGDILGFDTSADDGPAASFQSDYQHRYGWYPGVPIIDGRRRIETAVAGAARSMGNQQYTQVWSTDWHGEFRVDFVPVARIRRADNTTVAVTGGVTNGAFTNNGSGTVPAFYEAARAGNRFEVHPDVASHTVFSTCVVDPDMGGWFEDLNEAAELIMERGEKYRVTVPIRPYTA